MPTALPDMTLNTSTISWLLARLARPAQWSLDIYLCRYLVTDAEEGDEEEHGRDDDGVAPAQGPQQQPGQQAAHLDTALSV